MTGKEKVRLSPRDQGDPAATQDHEIPSPEPPPPAPDPLHTFASKEEWAGLAETPADGMEMTLSQVPGQAKPGAIARLPRLPDFQILTELGRGGMGIVYLARHRRLHRLVALKTMRSGSGADPGEMHRFRNEAEAVARLQHPGIVQIHEFGEHEGLAYFSLEYCDGGTLAGLLRESRPTPEQAARLILDLAHIVHHAHRRGIVHRDLKPANILLQRQSDTPPEAGGTNTWYSSRGCLKVADFGLARLLDRQVHTGSGQILGTPSYMAPEQASGRARLVGPGTDVYALGAILYEALTGSPPFRGTTVWETLRQVIEEEPASPGRVRADLDPGLERICLKCLRKEPENRYPSAQALAEDLERWLRGEFHPAERMAGFVQRWTRNLAPPRVDLDHRSLANLLFFSAGLSLLSVGWQLALQVRPEVWLMNLNQILFLFLLSLPCWNPESMVRKPDQAICMVLSSFWGGLLLACLALTWTSRHGTQMGIPETLPYSIWAVLTGLGCFSLGAFRWFGGFLCGGLFFVLAGIMPLLVGWAGPIFAGTWSLVLAALAVRLRARGK